MSDAETTFAALVATLSLPRKTLYVALKSAHLAVSQLVQDVLVRSLALRARDSKIDGDLSRNRYLRLLKRAPVAAS